MVVNLVLVVFCQGEDTEMIIKTHVTCLKSSRKLLKIADQGHLMRLWNFSSSVNSFFKCACTAIQWS